MSRVHHGLILAVPVTEHDHARGPAAAPVTLVEYGDCECPACGQAFPVVAAVVGEFGDRVRFVFRNFPLPTVHPHATAAAVAAEAAGLQGRFWEMHEVLYENHGALEPDDLSRYAAALGLDTDRFESDCAGEGCAARVRQDFLGGARSGVNGTPTFFANGVLHDGPHDFDSLASALARAVEEPGY